MPNSWIKDRAQVNSCRVLNSFPNGFGARESYIETLRQSNVDCANSKILIQNTLGIYCTRTELLIYERATGVYPTWVVEQSVMKLRLFLPYAGITCVRKDILLSTSKIRCIDRSFQNTYFVFVEFFGT
jgi:hypothetical protein